MGQRARLDRLSAVERMRQSLGYEATLTRGYAVVRDGEAVVATAKAAGKVQSLEIQFADGRIEVGNHTTPAPGRAKPKAAAKTGPKTSNEPEQGDLF